MLFKDDTDKPPTSKDEAAARRVRPPPEKYDPDKLSHWSITMTVAWIIWGEIDAVRNEWDDYRNECADWRFESHIARAKVAARDEAPLDRQTYTLARKLARFRKLQKDLRRAPGTFTNGNPLDGMDYV